MTPAPAHINDEEMIVSTTDYFVTESVLNTRATAADIAGFIRRMKTTGKLSYEMQRGGVRAIVVVERTRLAESAAKDVRQAIGMNGENIG
ncbi:MAG TPA: hypothetical protein VK638_06365 [Edaphobacter sp.]|nr:hypothetical protein [Edaphobacter sp.]